MHLIFKFRMTILDCIEESRGQCFLSMLSFPVLLLPVHMNELESQNHRGRSAADKNTQPGAWSKMMLSKNHSYKILLHHWLSNVTYINVKQIPYLFSNQWQLQKYKCIRSQRIQVAIRCTKLSVTGILYQSLNHCNELLIWMLLNTNFDLPEISC